MLQSLTIPYPLESKSDPGPLYQAFATSTSQGLYILAIQRKSMIFVPLAKDGEVVQPKISNFDATMLPGGISCSCEICILCPFSIDVHERSVKKIKVITVNF